MNRDLNDPVWTAYALGEVTDEKERAELEAIVGASPEIAALVAEIRETADLLSRELMTGPEPGLAPAQRAAVETRAAFGKTWFGVRPAWALAAAAAVILFVSFLAQRQLFRPDPGPEQMAAVIHQTAERPVPPPAMEEKSLAPAGPSAPQPERAESVAPEADAAAAPGAVPALPSPAQEEPAAQLPPVGNELTAGRQPLLLEESVTELPLASNDVMDLINIMGGVVKAEDPIFSNNTQTFAGVAAGNINIQRDGITAADVRYPAFPPRETDGGMPGELPKERRGWRRGPGEGFNTEAYAARTENPFLDALGNPLSTFSIDVDTASYSNVRRFLESGQRPPADAVRIEELVNYFDYAYAPPTDGKPFAVHFELTEAPWQPEHRLLRIGLKGREIKAGQRPASNLVFLVDVSGSMAPPNKLPLVKEALGLLVDRMTESDRVAIVVYAGDTRVWLPPTGGDRKERIREAIDRLRSGGSTAGASGIRLAYRTAEENFIRGGVNRVILATDGDFNVGVTSHGELTRLIEEKADSGVFLSALGFGMGNYKDSTLELLADRGRGNYAYIDGLGEAKKVLVEQMDATLVAIAKDVKIQVEFNPRHVGAYRLIGYENRLMAKEDFNDDAKRAGVIGAGHAVTALYELVPPEAAGKPGVDPLKYRKPAPVSAAAAGDELVTVKIRSKEPEGDRSVLHEYTVKNAPGKFARASGDFRFAAAVAAFGLVLGDSAHRGNADLERALEWAQEGKGADPHGYRGEFIRLVHRAASLGE
jgi:secreted protein with Ig-like and vWFA domain